MPMKRIAGLCMSCNEFPVLSRGQCSACYRFYKRLVDSGETTWAALIKKRLAKASLPRGRRSRAMVAMEKRKESESARNKPKE